MIIMEKDLLNLSKPGRYLGDEINARTKPFETAQVRFVLGFPDVYEVGMSHLGIQLLYHLLNGSDGVAADRVYAPWPDFERTLRTKNQLLRSLETKRTLKEFDFVGFSLQYELSYTNVLTMLDLGGIPLHAHKRVLGDPFVIGGGPCAFNPEPLAEFFDLFVLGEAEEVLPELIELFLEWKRSRGTRNEFLQEARKIKGIYVPSFFEVSYSRDGTIEAIIPRYADYAKIDKCVVADLDRNSPIPLHPLVPLLEIVHNRLNMELARGCTRGCRFCQAGFIYRPVRERRPEEVLRGTLEALANTGFEEVSLLSLSTGDYCQIQQLLNKLMNRLSVRKVAVSFPSMRVGTLTPDLMNMIRKVRKTGFTLAPEAGSDRLRRVINKDVDNEDLLSAAASAFELGWRLIKLYFMIGLPTEEKEDLDGIVDLCRQVWQLAKPSRSAVNVSFSTFVPKPHTPFQWVGQLPLPLIETHLAELKERLKKPGIRIKWHDPLHSYLEAVFARGDRRLSKVLMRAWELGARFDGWSETFRSETWERGFSELGVDSAFYVNRDRSSDELFPWEHLCAGVSKRFLFREYERALEGKYTKDCRFGGCSDCGVCDHKMIVPTIHTELGGLTEGEPRALRVDQREEFLYWFRFSKTGTMRFYGQLEISQCFSRAFRRTGLPVVMTKGFHPHIRISFLEALPLGLESLVEEAYVAFWQKLDPCVLQSSINKQLPRGLKIEEMVYTEKPLKRHSKYCVTYSISQFPSWWTKRIMRNWSQQQDAILRKKTKRGQIEALVKDVVLDFRPVSDETIELDLCEGEGMNFRPASVLDRLLDESVEALNACRICKVAVSPLVEAEGKSHVNRAHYKR